MPPEPSSLAKRRNLPEIVSKHTEVEDGREDFAGTELAGTETVMPANRQPDPIQEFSGWIKQNTRHFMRLAAKLIRYIDHWEFEWDGQTERLSLERFGHLTNLAVLDLFTEFSDENKARRIGIVRSRVGILADLRAYPPYKSITADIAAKLTALRDGEGLEVLAPYFESAAAYETAQTMFFAKKDRDRTDATREFMDRVAPKKSRGGDGNTLVVIVPQNQQQNLQETMEIMRGFQPDPVISAKRVRVPELPSGD